MMHIHWPPRSDIPHAERPECSQVRLGRCKCSLAHTRTTSRVQSWCISCCWFTNAINHFTRTAAKKEKPIVRSALSPCFEITVPYGKNSVCLWALHRVQTKKPPWIMGNALWKQSKCRIKDRKQYERVVSIIASENSSGWKGTSGKVIEPNLCLKARKKPPKTTKQCKAAPWKNLLIKLKPTFLGERK